MYLVSKLGFCLMVFPATRFLLLSSVLLYLSFVLIIWIFWRVSFIRFMGLLDLISLSKITYLKLFTIIWGPRFNGYLQCQKWVLGISHFRTCTLTSSFAIFMSFHIQTRLNILLPLSLSFSLILGKGIQNICNRNLHEI